MKEYPVYVKATICLFLVIMIIFLLIAGRPFLIPLSIAVLLTFLLMPVSRWLESKKVPKVAAIILSIILMILLLGGLIYFLSSQFLSFSEDMPVLKEKMTEKFGQLQSFITDNFYVSEKKQADWMRGQMINTMESSGDMFGSIFSATGSFLAAATLIPIYIFFFTLYRHKFIDFMKHLTNPEKHNWMMDILHRTSLVSQKYLVGILIDMAILTVLNSIGFLILGINHAILLAVIAAILNIIPYVGVLIGSIFPITMALLTKDSIWIAVGALGVCVFVQFLDNNFITPKVVGSAVSINPLATLLVLLIGGYVWGIAGMMLFIPFLGMVKVILDNVESLRPFGFLIGEEERFRSGKKAFFTSKKKS